MVTLPILFAMLAVVMASLLIYGLYVHITQLKYTRFIKEINANPIIPPPPATKEIAMQQHLRIRDLTLEDLNLILVAYKDLSFLDVYGKRIEDPYYRKILGYPIADFSGELGPKRAQGDLQVPEGYYHIDLFNPKSKYFMSMRINYPNASDLIKKKAEDPGDLIYIHGGTHSEGCLAMSNEVIEELYVLCSHARDNGQEKIPVYIFPFRMTDEVMEKHRKKYSAFPEHITFWENMKPGYDRFMEQPQELSFSVAENGDYVF